jgi:hypothetical protein
MGIKAPKGYEPTAEDLAALGPALRTCVIRFDSRHRIEPPGPAAETAKDQREGS